MESRRLSVFTKALLSAIFSHIFSLPACFGRSYKFEVKSKNELGAGPVSEPVSFNTESGTEP